MLAKALSLASSLSVILTSVISTVDLLKDDRYDEMMMIINIIEISLYANLNVKYQMISRFFFVELFSDEREIFSGHGARLLLLTTGPFILKKRCCNKAVSGKVTLKNHLLTTTR